MRGWLPVKPVELPPDPELKRDVNKLVLYVAVALTALVALILGVGIFIGKSCSPVTTTIETTIDAGAELEKIDDRETEAIEAAAAELAAIEAKRQEDLDALEDEQRAEYDRIREKGPDAVLDWLNDFDRERFP